MTGMHLRFEDVHYRYPAGVEAIRGVSLAIEPGERVAIVGQNGAGKTTLVRHLNGIFKPTAGTVHVGDWLTTDHDIAELAARVGYVFQNPDEQLFARSVQADVEFGPRNLGVVPEETTRRAEQALATVGLVEQKNAHPHHLSLSERKRVALAGVLAMHTPIVVLDEPTTGQDAAGIDMVGKVMDTLAADGRTVIVITHDMDFCAEHFPRVVVMTNGQIQADGDARTVFGLAQTLAEAAVEPPQLIRLSQRLGWGYSPLNTAEFVEYCARRRSERVG